jgi:hypothetical protein
MPVRRVCFRVDPRNRGICAHSAIVRISDHGTDTGRETRVTDPHLHHLNGRPLSSMIRLIAEGRGKWGGRYLAVLLEGGSVTYYRTHL